jgi:acid phosphatase
MMMQSLKKYHVILFVFLSLVGFDSYVECSYKGRQLQEQNRNCSVKPMNLSDAKKAILDYYDSGCFIKEINAVVDKAIQYFKKLDISNMKKPTVIFDIDDSVLWTLPEQKATEFGYIQDYFHNWVMQGDAPAVPGTKRLFDFLLTHGYTVIFLTGRFASEREATIKNLRDNGFVGYEKLITRDCENRQEKASVYKPAQRAKLATEGYTIVGSVGDQWSDMVGIDNKVAQVKLPNYFYTIG